MFNRMCPLDADVHWKEPTNRHSTPTHQLCPTELGPGSIGLVVSATEMHFLFVSKLSLLANNSVLLFAKKWDVLHREKSHS